MLLRPFEKTKFSNLKRIGLQLAPEARGTHRAGSCQQLCDYQGKIAWRDTILLFWVYLQGILTFSSSTRWIRYLGLPQMWPCWVLPCSGLLERIEAGGLWWGGNQGGPWTSSEVLSWPASEGPWWKDGPCALGTSLPSRSVVSPALQ